MAGRGPEEQHSRHIYISHIYIYHIYIYHHCRFLNRKGVPTRLCEATRSHTSRLGRRHAACPLPCTGLSPVWHPVRGACGHNQALTLHTALPTRGRCCARACSPVQESALPAGRVHLQHGRTCSPVQHCQQGGCMVAPAALPAALPAQPAWWAHLQHGRTCGPVQHCQQGGGMVDHPHALGQLCQVVVLQRERVPGQEVGDGCVRARVCVRVCVFACLCESVCVCGWGREQGPTVGGGKLGRRQLQALFQFGWAVHSNRIPILASRQSLSLPRGLAKASLCPCNLGLSPSFQTTSALPHPHTPTPHAQPAPGYAAAAPAPGKQMPATCAAAARRAAATMPEVQPPPSALPGAAELQ